MALNPINMQISVPRIPEASNIQQQAMQKPVVDQTELGEQALKKTEETRSKTQKTTETDKVLIRDEQQSSNQQQQPQHKNRKQHTRQDAATEKTIHPYKGHSIDIKL